MNNFKQNLNNQRERFAKVFQDTLDYIKTNETLNSSVGASRADTVFYKSSFDAKPSAKEKVYFNNVFVTKSKTVEAALRLHKEYPAHRIAILNFASATNPGGGVVKGSSAQEESICRITTLYPCLNTRAMYEVFYNPHRATADPLHNDDIIYTPDVVVCKTDDGTFTRLPEKDFVKIDVITCAAPNLREKPSNDINQEGTSEAVSITDEELYEIHLSRARAILNAAQLQGAEILVLGAFGCGVFKNNPRIVARAYKEALKDNINRFKEVEFAIYCKGYETENYDAFTEEFE